jgi:DNA-binding transcriptional MerR regulator
MEGEKQASRGPLTIGAVARATGLSTDTLRVWQKRYGFPAPERKASGHRLYSPGDVRRLRRISEALSRGHRPAQVVPMAEVRLQSLLTETVGPAAVSETMAFPSLLPMVRRHDGAALSAILFAEAARLGPIEFLRRRVAPLIEEVGEAWAFGEIGIHHEHFFSERLSDVLRTIRLPYERTVKGPRITLATFPGETHALGLQMAALVAAVSGLEPHLLGTDLPVAEIASAVRSRRSAAVGVSVSVSTAGSSTRDQLAQLRRAMSSALPILVGGRGARRSHPPGGSILIEDLPGFFDWARRFAARA